MERWRALRQDCAMVPGIDLLADMLLLQGLMHSVNGPLPWSVARAVAAFDEVPVKAGQSGQQVAGLSALLAALTAEASRTLTTLSSSDCDELLVARDARGAGTRCS